MKPARPPASCGRRTISDLSQISRQAEPQACLLVRACVPDIGLPEMTEGAYAISGAISEGPYLYLYLPTTSYSLLVPTYPASLRVTSRAWGGWRSSPLLLAGRRPPTGSRPSRNSEASQKSPPCFLCPQSIALQLRLSPACAVSVFVPQRARRPAGREGLYGRSVGAMAPPPSTSLAPTPANTPRHQSPCRYDKWLWPN